MKSAFDRGEPGLDVLHRVAPGVYSYTTDFTFEGRTYPLYNRSVVVHVPGLAPGELGSLVIINPARLPDGVAAAIRGLEGELHARVRYLISTGDWHHLFIGEHLSAFPEATAYLPPGRIPKQNPSYPYCLIDVLADNPFPGLAPHVTVQRVAGLLDFIEPEKDLPRHELVFFLPDAGALCAGDALWYFTGAHLPEAMAKAGTVADTLQFHFAKEKMVRNPRELAESLDRILLWDFDRFIPVHGGPGNMQERGAKDGLRAIASWVGTLGDRTPGPTP